ncbi:structural maintenance of chromosomes protein 1B isoform X1 [Rhineura floridana]|uniref:structural maintenance of chromosomes protein 1B isoform X1 n=2 Tax=Rhineura floridana TaxID=261503 RepID=UPI002AC7EE83|nr:structural maintenance of chromosomes protein 1B isoform X1 [Rhineura floridana]XP_061438399.1 structural maintenance of chromosomes protein 1B isoform X1 [Rhineura floridana]XP_061438401.1 structural maintenance of chromosomes protein 1B isoform X1 [Rhineura floridana]XP_061438402.1 structural maintenance of chromosomes protein 1B isoform X1 [Rhineura floridana]XP_061438403.1 structural maintenance of chromosomes protein 1B isoform X1 [Rhineura floridana]XP_061438404.1 structural maintenan
MGYLKLLIVENFKSWQGKQCIGPFKKFTCVIGPNGSGNTWEQLTLGKSNIMDALSFVMGEKTSNLRVKHIQELIHGAHVGKPVSCTGSVRMVYSEENGEDKTFSRIIRGNGSEFLVNDVAVSRSMYTKELEEIGIIARARNCLVFQGEVETIAMKKPKERTQLFEQISNSGEFAADYAEKKKNMQQAEEEAQFSYNKKKNVAAERKRAKLEKEEAEHYQMLFEELGEYRGQLQLFKLYHNEQKINLINNKLAAKNTNISAKKTAVSHAEEAVKAKKKMLGVLNRNQQQIEKEIKSLEVVLNQKRPQYIKAKERTSHQIKKVDTAKKVLRDHIKEQAKQEENKKELETELMDIDKAWRVFEKKVEEKTLHRERDVLLEENQLNKYKELKELVRKKVAILTQQLEKLQWEQKADEDKMSSEQRRLSETEESIKQVMEHMEDHEKRIEKLTEYSRTCSESLAQKKQEEVALANEIESSKIRMAQVNEELHKIVSELHNAKIDVHEGKRQQMKAENLESLKRLYPDYVFGRLLDLCHPIHKKYQLAVTKVFGRYMTAIVVASEKVARDCIRFLKEERAEPETFLPLDYLEVEPINEQLREIKGSKMMIDVIQTSFPPLKKVIQFVCGNGLVCETVKEARQIAFDGPYRLKTVALDGTLFLKSGIISGGSSYLKMKARYWDEKEMNGLKERREKLMNELKNLLKIKCKEADLKHLQAQCQGIQTRHKYSQNELEVLKKKHLANLYKEKSMLESELVNTQSQHAMLNEGVLQRATKMDELQKKMHKVEDSVFREFCAEIGVDNIRVYEKEYLQEQEEIDKKRFQFENQKMRLSVQLEYICSLIDKKVKNNNMLKENICNDEADIICLKKDEEKFLQMAEEVMAELQQLRERQNVIKSEVAEAQNQVEELRKTLLTLNRELVKLQKEGVAIETLLEQKKLERHNRLLECKLQDLKIKLLLGSLDDISEIELGSDTETSEVTADIYEREQAIHIDYSSLAEELKDLQSDKEIEIHLEQLQQEVASKENVLSKTAAPNLRALQRLHIVTDRFQESVDAFEARRREARLCRQEFEKVKKRRHELFSQCFEHVSVAIDQVYKKLCRNNSAQAFLSPENPEEPYLEGISYNCVAPGKRFMPMDNLSGGEKSVAALALVFAVHSFRPAPFFVLDEVDAALDNTNIGKVSNFIRQQSQEKFQIIVISLKEEFYCKADALVGVCPQQDAFMFSQVLTLDLTRYPDSDENERQQKYRKSSMLK